MRTHTRSCMITAWALGLQKASACGVWAVVHAPIVNNNKSPYLLTCVITCHGGDDSVTFVWLAVASRSTCSPECTDDGCWGPGDSQCLACRNYNYDNRCLPSCDVETGLYEVANGNSSRCGKCHDECFGSCRKEASFIISIKQESQLTVTVS